MNADWETYRIKTRGGLTRALVYRTPSGNLRVEMRLSDYARTVHEFTPVELERFVKRRRWCLELVSHFS